MFPRYKVKEKEANESKEENVLGKLNWVKYKVSVINKFAGVDTINATANDKDKVYSKAEEDIEFSFNILKKKIKSYVESIVNQ